MVTDANGDQYGPGDGKARSPAETQRPIPYGLTERGRRAVGGRVDSIAERLDGAYIPDTGEREAQAVHGWYYPDPDEGSRALPPVYSKAA